MTAREIIELPVESRGASETRRYFVWDLPVRIFHWALVIAIVAAFITNKFGVTYFKYHVWCGYTVLVLVAFRIVWGIVGTYHARFLNFVRSPFETWNYMRHLLRDREKKYLGHNPLGALMVIVLLAALLVQTVTGLFGNDEIFNVGPLYGYISNELSLQLTSLHRQLFYWVLGAIGIHIAAVFAHRVFKREGLIAAMFTGYKDIANNAAVDNKVAAQSSQTQSSPIWLAVAIVIIFSGALTWLVMQAPVAVSDLGY